MRISDWSSDVCSSDLLFHAAEHFSLVAQGCMCSARRGDIAKALHDLIRRARRQGGSWIEEALIETSGVADTAPIIATLLQAHWLRDRVPFRGVFTVFAAVVVPVRGSVRECVCT